MLQILEKLPQKWSKYCNFNEILQFFPKKYPNFYFFLCKGGLQPPKSPPFDAPGCTYI